MVKKKHTVKNVVVINDFSEILWCSRTYGGRNHDKKIADEAPLEAFVGEMLADSGFQGLQKQYSKIKLPYKKPHKSELSDEKKEFNKQLASKRIKIEHVFAHLKIFRIISEICRCKRVGFHHLVFKLICALYNMRLSLKPD